MDNLLLNLEKVNLKNVEKEEILKKIENINKLFKECKSPCLNKDIEKLIEDLKEYGIDNPDIPDELKILWKVSSEWHLIKNHCDVFGFNIYSPKDVIQITYNIFGDESIREEWNEVGTDIFRHKCLCGNKDWVCISGYSEYDYIFVNLNKDSLLFGATRHIVNNCGEDNELTDSPFEKFIDYIQNKIQEIIDMSDYCDSEEDKNEGSDNGELKN